MGISAIGAKPLLASILLAIFALSMVFEFTNRELLVPYYIALMLAAIWFRESIAASLSFTGLSRDMAILAALGLITVAALHIHTIEVVWGLAKAALAAVYQAGFYLGTAFARL